MAVNDLPGFENDVRSVLRSLEDAMQSNGERKVVAVALQWLYDDGCSEFETISHPDRFLTKHVPQLVGIMNTAQIRVVVHDYDCGCTPDDGEKYSVGRNQESSEDDEDGE